MTSPATMPPYDGGKVIGELVHHGPGKVLAIDITATGERVSLCGILARDGKSKCELPHKGFEWGAVFPR
jgi:hypothetical protein